MFTKVLIPLDGSELAAGILPYITQIVAKMGMSAVLLAVVEPDDLRLRFRLRERAPSGEGAGEQLTATSASRIDDTGAVYRTRIEENAQTAAVKSLKPASDELSKRGGIESIVEAVTGDPATEIIKAAERHGCDLIAMATHGRNMIARGILGSVTDKVLHASHVPVLTVAPDDIEAETKLSTVVVPLDGSPLSESALPYAEALAKALSLKMKIVRVVPIGWAVGYEIDSYHPQLDDIETEMVDDATVYLRGIRAELATDDIEVEWKVLRGTPARALVELGRGDHHDIFVISTHGRSGLTRWVLGSVTEAVVRASRSPVLVIPPKVGKGGGKVELSK